MDLVKPEENAKESASLELISQVFGCIAYVMTPPVPAERLLGKSPEYVIFYTNEYEKTMQKKHVEQASIGCLIQTGAVFLYYLYSTGELL